MAYTTAEGRAQVLDAVAAAAERLGLALESLGEAYEQLDEHAADRLEAALFRPVQVAYGRAQRVHAEFAQRHELAGRSFEPPAAGRPSRGAKVLVEDAVEDVAAADAALAELQDSMLPIEVGDASLRAGISDVREQIAGTRARGRELTRTFGR